MRAQSVLNTLLPVQLKKPKSHPELIVAAEIKLCTTPVTSGYGFLDFMYEYV
jgi:hypothetical protein